MVIRNAIRSTTRSPLRNPLDSKWGKGSPLSITAPSNYYYLTSASPYDIGTTLVVADSEDAGGDYTVAITLTGGGTLTLSGTTGLTGSGSGTSSLSYSGTLSAWNTALDGADIAGLSDETATMSITLTRDADSIEISRNVTVNAYPALAITTLDPADDATGIVYNRSTYTATFNRTIQAGTGNVVLKLVGGAALETFNIATGVGDEGGTVTISGADLIIAPGVNLTDDTAHAIQIASTAIDGANIGTGDSFAGIANDTSWSFTCEDTTPTLSSPLDSATGGTTATAAVTTDRGDGTLYWVITTSATTPSHAQIVAGDDHTDTAAAATGSQAVSATGSQTVSSITGLTSETTYYTHFAQASANGAEATPVSADGFTTDDVTAPTIASSVPADDATGVAVDATIAITFDENVVFAYPGGGTLSLKLVDGATVETYTPSSTTAATGDNGGSVAIVDDVVTITLGADMAETTAHAVRIAATCIEDVAGNAFAGIADDTTLSFTTGVADIYVVEGLSPPVVADFENDYYRVGGSDTSFASMFTFSRTGPARYLNSSGVWTEATTGVARTSHHKWNGSAWVRAGILLETEARTNLLLNSGTMSTQNVTTSATPYTLSFSGTGTVTLSGTSTAGPLVGTGTGENNRVNLTFTPTAGTLTLTVSGTVTNAQCEAGSTPSSYIPTAGSTATRSAESLSIAAANMSYSATAMSFHISGGITYIDDGSEGPFLYEWYSGSGTEQIFLRLDNQAARTGGPKITQRSAEYNAQLFYPTFYTPGVNVAFNVAARHTSAEMNVAKDGVDTTVETTPSDMPTLSAIDFDLFYGTAGGAKPALGNITIFRQWDDDIGNAGIETAST